MPEYFLDYREVLDPMTRWTDRLQSSSGDWTGNLFDFFFRIYGKPVKDLKIPFKLDGITRIYSVWEQQGWKQPEVIEEYRPDRTILRLSFVKKVAIKKW